MLLRWLLLQMGYFLGARSMGTPSTYDQEVAQVLAEYSAAAYACDEPRCQKWQCVACRLHPNTEVLRFHNDTDSVSGFVGYDNDLDKIIVSFSGTHVNAVNSWVQNINPAVVDYPCLNCQVHLGFLNAYESMKTEVLDNLAYVLSKYPAADIWVTGHSLGGALAMLCVADLHSNHLIGVQALYTFGQPRVGNSPFAAWFIDTLGDAAFFRVVHDKDPIVHAPPTLLGFAHSPTEVFYNAAESTYRLCDDTGEDPSCSDRYIMPWDLNPQDHLVYLGVAM